MSERDDERQAPGFLDTFREPGARNYVFIGFAALILFFVVMSEHGLGVGPLLMIIIAVPGLIGRWVISPALFLILLTYQFIDPDFAGLIEWLSGSSRTFGYGLWKKLSLIDMILVAVPVLAYVMAQFRVLSFVHKSMPEDPPPRRKGQPEPETPRRPFRLFVDKELLRMLGVGLLAVAIGLVTWVILDNYERWQRLGGRWGVTRSFALVMLFLWVLGTLTILTGAVFRYLELSRMSRLQARLLLQDSFWEETRREQERIHRWRRWCAKRTVKQTSSQGS